MKWLALIFDIRQIQAFDGFINYKGDAADKNGAQLMEAELF